MSIVAMLIVGILVGLIASMLMGGTGLGIIVDLLVGLAGSFIGSWLFLSHLSMTSSNFTSVLPMSIAGTITFLLLFSSFCRFYYRFSEA
jgi:uncharacterized membrane protein YeaQ/YmgE (transglycosylase-associated protein family)